MTDSSGCDHLHVTSYAEGRQSRTQETEPPDVVFIIGPPGSPTVSLARALASMPATTPLAEEPAPPVDLGREGDRRTGIGGRAGAGRVRAGGLSQTRTAVDGASRRALQIPHLRETFRDPRFILCWLPSRDAMASAYAGWRSGKVVSHPGLEGWRGPAWSYALVPGWRGLADSDLGTIVAEQWARASRVILRDLAALDPATLSITTAEALSAGPVTELERLSRAIGIDPEGAPGAAALLRSELDAAREREADGDAHPAELEAALGRAAEVAAEAEAWFAARAGAVATTREDGPVG